MDSMISGVVMPHLLPSVGPALMISMEYIDLGKWVAVVDCGARFGFDLVILVLLFNCTAILCQYLSTCVGTATGKDLAQICSEEYCRGACILLGVQAELSLIISDVSTILGIALGLNLLSGMDIYMCIVYATVGLVLLPSFVNILDNHKAEALHVGIAGFTLLFYVFGVLISQPEVPLTISGVFPKLSGDSAYSVMALLGANVMAHNFYIQSSIVKQQKKQPNVAMGALFHDHFFASLFIFTGIFLVNYVLINSAAAVFGSTDVVFNFQDISLLMDQIFRSPIAPVAFFLVLFFASQITGLSRNIGGQVIFRCFFGINSSSVHQTLVRVLTIIPALYSAKSAGSEGIYQLLILCQVILATLLPSSVIPLFRVASSRFNMGSFKIPWHLEILALFAFLVMFASNIFFVVEMLFGNSDWMINPIGQIVLLLIACLSIGLTLFLAVTPLKSSSDRPEAEIWTSKVEQDQAELPEIGEDDNLDVIKFDKDQDSSVEFALEKSIVTQSEKSLLEFNIAPHDSTIDSDHDSHQSANSSSISAASMTPEPKLETNSAVEVDLTETSDNFCSEGSLVLGIQGDELKELCIKDEGEEACIHTARDNDERGGSDDSFKGFPVLPPEGTGSCNNINPKGADGLNGSGSLSKLSGLGRAARRQLASVLDEFWRNLFDFHGKLTQEATISRLDALLGLDLIRISGEVFPPNSRDHNSAKQIKNHNVELPFGAQMGTSYWSQNLQLLDALAKSSSSDLLDLSERRYSSLNLRQFSDNRDHQPATVHSYQLNSLAQSSSGNLLDPSERRYSSLNPQQFSDNRDHQPATIHGYQLKALAKSSSSNLVDLSERRYSSLNPQQFSDNRDHQPATIHGYQLASYLREINATRNTYSSSVLQNLPPTPRSVSSTATPRDQVMYNELSLARTNLQNPALSRISRLQPERPYYDTFSSGADETELSSSHTKKYHSTPDISALIALSRTAYLNEAKHGTTIGPRQPLGRMASEQSQCVSPVSTAPLAFDQLSPMKLQRDDVSLNQSLNSDAKSLWSRQPYEQLFGMECRDQSAHKKSFSYAESGANLLQSLRSCIKKLLKLEGSEWLFRQSGGFDEELIDWLAKTEKYSRRVDNGEMNQASSRELLQSSSFQGSEEAGTYCCQSIPNCGDGCIWQASLVISFGVWCIRRILELSLVESRPELWGKYTYVLNRLQGIIEPAFSKPRKAFVPCTCLQRPTEGVESFNASKPLTTATTILEIIKDVEIAVSGRKGRTGTAAGDVAFPKGKENLASVLKRYKRRLLNKSPGSHEGTSISRKSPSVSSYVL